MEGVETGANQKGSNYAICHLTDGNVRAFGYDPNDRLLSSASSAPSAVSSEAFAYDRVGNWTPYQSRLHNAANEITEDSTYIYSYDLDGNLIEKPRSSTWPM